MPDWNRKPRSMAAGNRCRCGADIRAHGHTLGHYLTACALMYASTGDEEFKKRCDYIVAELQECQNADPTGFVSAFPDKAVQIDNLVRRSAASSVCPGIRCTRFSPVCATRIYIANSAAALDVLVKLSDWAIKTTENMTDEQFERMLRTEHGGMNEVLADVYVLTNQAKYLDLAERFCHQALLAPLAESRDTLNGQHSNTQIPKVVGFARLYELTGKETIERRRSSFGKPWLISDRLSPAATPTMSISFPPATSRSILVRPKRWKRAAATTCCD